VPRALTISALYPQNSDAHREATDPEQCQNTAQAMPVLDPSEHCDTDCEHGEATDKPKGDERPPALGLLTIHGNATIHVDHERSRSLRRSSSRQLQDLGLPILISWMPAPSWFELHVVVAVEKAAADS